MKFVPDLQYAYTWYRKVYVLIQLSRTNEAQVCYDKVEGGHNQYSFFSFIEIKRYFSPTVHNPDYLQFVLIAQNRIFGNDLIVHYYDH